MEEKIDRLHLALPRLALLYLALPEPSLLPILPSLPPIPSPAGQRVS